MESSLLYFATNQIKYVFSTISEYPINIENYLSPTPFSVCVLFLSDITRISSKLVLLRVIFCSQVWRLYPTNKSWNNIFHVFFFFSVSLRGIQPDFISMYISCFQMTPLFSQFKKLIADHALM
jgi:hypothetical protein